MKTKFFTCIVILIFVSCGAVFSQTVNFDSLKKEINQTTDEKNKAKLLNKIGHLYHAVNPQEGMALARQALNLAHKIDLKIEIANAYLVLGECYYILSDYPKSIDNYQKALKIHEENGHDKGIATSLINIAVIYEAQQNFPKATEYYKKALNIYEKMQDIAGMALIQGNLGILYGSQGNDAQALQYFQKALEMYEKLADKEGIARNLVNLGEIYKNENNFQKALDYYNKALKMNLELSDKRGLAIIYLNIGETFSKQKKFKDANEYFEKSLVASKELDYKEAMIYAYKNLSDGYTGLGEYKNALDYYSKYVKLKDSVFSEENERKISNLTASYLAEKQEKENEALREKNNLQMKYFFVILILIFVIFIFMYLRYRIKQKSLKLITEKNFQIEHANSELENLNHELSETNASKDKFFQIISHELMNPIRWMSNVAEMLPKRINSMSPQELKELADVLSQTTSQSNKLLENLLHWARLHTGRVDFSPQTINLLEIVNEILSLVEPQVNDKKQSVDVDIPESTVVFADRNMLGAILRNLIENAVKFTNLNGIITIKAETDAKRVNISIGDNGIGISANNLEKLFRIDIHHTTTGTAKEKGTGFGLILCKEYIEKHGGVIRVESEEGKGSKFIFAIPKD